MCIGIKTDNLDITEIYKFSFVYLITEYSLRSKWVYRADFPYKIMCW